jgi:hypothetical protein
MNANKDRVIVFKASNNNLQWSEQELATLGQLSSIGFPIDCIAKFFVRDLDEVRERASAP